MSRFRRSSVREAAAANDGVAPCSRQIRLIVLAYHCLILDSQLSESDVRECECESENNLLPSSSACKSVKKPMDASYCFLICLCAEGKRRRKTKIQRQTEDGSLHLDDEDEFPSVSCAKQ